ncbi:MAG TPA: glutamate racemase, partial [Flavobacterium sp.]|nr:glutamate racemase [Flavobacterium sp.]
QLIENGEMESSQMTSLLKKYLNPMIESNIDYLVLGCSHYPYLIPQIKKIIPPHIQIIDSGEAVAKQTKNVLQQLNLLRLENKKVSTIFYTNSNANVLKNVLKKTATIITSDF